MSQLLKVLPLKDKKKQFFSKFNNKIFIFLIDTNKERMTNVVYGV